ncbi:MAG: hypothetical protein IIB83_04115 [Bacteroidetes bacterium]|nr:hypothetical protein [Bacteroidota bacterium]
MTVLETIIVSVLSTLGTAAVGFFFYYLRVLMKEKSLSKAELKENKRTSFQKLLDEHAKLLLDLNNDKPIKVWLKEFSDMSKSILLWSSDEVLEEYGKYVELYSSKHSKIEERELYFAKAILAFRQELGYKNKKDKITPQQVVLIFRSGYKSNI